MHRRPLHFARVIYLRREGYNFYMTLGVCLSFFDCLLATCKLAYL